MKQVVNFRLNAQAIFILTELKKTRHESKTTIVEQALKYYAKKQLPKQNPMLQYAGCLSHHDAKNMLENMKRHRHNKDLDIEL